MGIGLQKKFNSSQLLGLKQLHKLKMKKMPLKPLLKEQQKMKIMTLF